MSSERPTPETLERLESHVDEALRRGRLATAAYAVVWRGEVLLSKGVGRTAWDHGETVTADTPFGIGSLTKSMTATALLQLQERGVVDLDRPVRAYVPWFGTADPESSSQITVRHLLNQTSGLGNGAWRVALDDPSLHTSLERTVRAFARCPPVGAPGTTWAYSNAGFAAAGYVIEAVSGVPYADFVAEHVFAPAGMTQSTFDIETAERLGCSRPHQVRLGRRVEVPVRMDPSFAPAGMALYCSASDMARYLIAQLDGTLLDPSSTADAWRGQAEPPIAGMDERYGLGWMISGFHGHELVFHHGGTEGHSAAMCIVPDEGLGVVLLAGIASTEPTNIAMDMVRILLGQAPTGTGGLPDVERALSTLSVAMGALGVVMGASAVAAMVSTITLPWWLLLLNVPATASLLIAARLLRRSQWSPFPVPMNIGGGGWGTGLAVGWGVLVAGGASSILATLLGMAP